MQKSPTFSDGLSKLGHNSVYIEQLNNLQFKLEINLKELPDDPTLESPVYKEQDFINIKQMMSMKKK